MPATESTTVPNNLNLPAGTTISPIPVKQERHDEQEIQKLAEQMRESQKQALEKQQQQQAAQQQIAANSSNTQVQAAAGNGQRNILNYLIKKGAQDPPPPQANGAAVDLKNLDEESQKGRFGWATFGTINIPYIIRQPTEKYCAIKMIELKLLSKYLSHLHPDIYQGCTSVPSYYITDAESRLLNEINHKHCDAQFGRDFYVRTDLVVRLADANKFYQFLDICYRKLVAGAKSDTDKCGFIRIDKESVIPYTAKNKEKFVPLFYFEGEIENLKQKAESLSGWDLAYLKFCCKVQGIRNELFATDTLNVINLKDIKNYFPDGTKFEEFWPTTPNNSNLLLRTKTVSNSVNWTKQPLQPPPPLKPTNPIPVQKLIPRQPPKKQPTAVGTVNTQQRAYGQTNVNGMWPGANTQTNVHQMFVPNGQFAQIPPAPSIIPNLLPNGQNNYSSAQLVQLMNQQQQQQQPTPYVQSVQDQYAVAQIINTAMRQPTNGNRASNLPQNRHAPTATQAQYNTNQRLYVVPEITTATMSGSPYKVRHISIENVMLPSINLKAYIHNEQIVSLAVVQRLLFPHVSTEYCRRMIENLGSNLYQLNKTQYRTLLSSGQPCFDNVPFIHARDLQKIMPQLRYMAENHQSGQEQQPAKRTRRT